MAEAPIPVSVAYAERERQTLVELEVPAGTTVAGAIERSAIHARHPGIPPGAALGVHGVLVKPDRVLEAGDRVEIYRGLPADPRDTRRTLAREGRTMGARRR